MESNYVHSALRPSVGLLVQSWVIMIMEKLVEWWLAGETEVLGENLLQCTLSATNPTSYPNANLGRRYGEPGTNCLTYSKALHPCKNRHLKYEQLSRSSEACNLTSHL
jgi:hypothetical protein